MVSEIDKAWLAGFIDADGCVRLSKGWKNRKEIHSLIPQVTIHNTCIVTLNHAIKILDEIIPGYQTSNRKRVSDKHSSMFNINIMGIKRVKPLLDEIEKYMVTKNLEARMMKQFISLRTSAKSHNAHYGKTEYKIYFALKELKKTRHLRDYVPTIEDILNQDIVRTNARALEEVEITSRLSEDDIKKRASKLVWYRKDRSQSNNEDG